VQKSGSWYSYNGEKIGQGKDNVKNFLKEHPDKADEIEAKIRAEAFANLSLATTSTDADADLDEETAPPDF
jgi:recombination protein RecA